MRASGVRISDAMGGRPVIRKKATARGTRGQGGKRERLEERVGKLEIINRWK
jgi:hypothetical protein